MTRILIATIATMTMVCGSAFTSAQAPEQPKPPVTEQVVPRRQAAPTQPPAAPTEPQAAPAQPAVQTEQPAQAPKPVPSVPQVQAQEAVIAPALLIGRWDINVDSYLDTRLANKGKYEHPAKIAAVRNQLKAGGMNVRLDFAADGCIDVAKTYCGDCEEKTGRWCVTCVEGQQMTVEVESKHGWFHKTMLVSVCDDLHIRVIAPTEIAGIYERVPDAVQEGGVPPQLQHNNVQPQGEGAPKPSTDGYDEPPPAPGIAPTAKTRRVVPQRRPLQGSLNQKPELGESTDEIAP